MADQTQEKRLIYIGFWTYELQDLIEYLKTSGYSGNELVSHLEKILQDKQRG